MTKVLTGKELKLNFTDSLLYTRTYISPNLASKTMHLLISLRKLCLMGYDKKSKTFKDF